MKDENAIFPAKSLPFHPSSFILHPCALPFKMMLARVRVGVLIF
jgi:hypothetical protein